MAKSREVDCEKLARNTRSLQSLPIGTPVAIQIQSGRYPTKLDKATRADRSQGGRNQEVNPKEQEVCT